MASAEANSFALLKQLIEENNGVDYVYLTDNIVYASGGIRVAKNKGNITIDGNNFSITDVNSSTLGDTIYVPEAGGIIDVTIKNVVFYGRNFYGMVSFAEGTNNQQATFYIENVTYSGPQAIWHRRGKTHVKNSSFRIGPYNGTTVTDEFCETNQLVLEGEVSIHSTVARGAHSCMYLTHASPSFNVLPGAVVKIELPNTYLIFCESAVNVLVGEGSTFDMTCNAGMFYADSTSSHVAANFVVDSLATFRIVQTGYHGEIGTVRTLNNFTVNAGGTVYIQSDMASSPPSIQVVNNGTVNFNNPANVVLYSRNNATIKFRPATTNTINFNTELLSIWHTAADIGIAGTFSDPPLHGWQKIDYTDIVATANSSANTITSMPSNVDSLDYGGVLDATTFTIANIKVLSCGRLPIQLEPITDRSTEISGTTRPNADLRVIYDTTELSGQADQNGDINMPFALKVSVGDILKIKANWSFLTKIINEIVIGSLKITYYPPVMAFGRHSVPLHRSFLNRTTQNCHIEVTDTREVFTPWQLQIAITGPLYNGTVYLDDETVVYMKDTAVQTVKIVPITIYEKEERLTSPEVTNIDWTDIEGILLDVDPDTMYQGGVYVTTLQWLLFESN